MNFELTDEQRMLMDATADLLTKAYGGIEDRNRVTAAEPGWNPDTWAALAAMGLPGMCFAEADGGTGAGPVEAMLVATEIGRRLAPEPLFDAAVLPGGLITDFGSAEQRARLLPEIADGRLRAAFAHHEPGARWPDSRVGTAATLGPDGWSLTGVKNPVLHGDGAAVLVVSAALLDGGVGLFLVDPDAIGVSRIGYRTHDGLRGAQITFTDAAAEPLGEPVDRTDGIADHEVRAHAALCAEAVGVMSETLRLTCDYLKTRRQFGVPLASFQTLTQRAADMYVALELARSMTLYLTMAIDGGASEPTIASRARLQVSRSARLIGQEAVQMHGGIGLTAEYPVAHYVSRLTAIDHTLGSGDDHLRRLMEGVADYTLVTLDA